MLIFERSINSKAYMNNDEVKIIAIFKDDIAHYLKLTVFFNKNDKVIEDVDCEMPKTPFDKCKGVKGIARKIIGLRVEKGISKKIFSQIGGREGCVHLAELAVEAVKMFSLLVMGIETEYFTEGYKKLSEKEQIELSKKYLKDTCFVFSD
ncbi:MAG: DUF2889 domain-containing protein [Desulfurellaceae bacterium]|nr:DUF2889 domain-containing protein [Desulfurellaceae bacterium]